MHAALGTAGTDSEWCGGCTVVAGTTQGQAAGGHRCSLPCWRQPGDCGARAARVRAGHAARRWGGQPGWAGWADRAGAGASGTDVVSTPPHLSMEVPLRQARARPGRLSSLPAATVPRSRHLDGCSWWPCVKLRSSAAPLTHWAGRRRWASPRPSRCSSGRAVCCASMDGATTIAVHCQCWVSHATSRLVCTLGSRTMTRDKLCPSSWMCLRGTHRAPGQGHVLQRATPSSATSSHPWWVLCCAAHCYAMGGMCTAQQWASGELQWSAAISTHGAHVHPNNSTSLGPRPLPHVHSSTGPHGQGGAAPSTRG